MKEKESPSQLSDFVAAAAAEAAASETTRPSSTLDDTNNQTTTSEEQTPVSRAFNSSDILQRKSSSNTNSSLSSSSTSASPVVQQKSHSRSSSSSSTNSSLQKKAKLNDDTSNRSLNDLSQFVQLNKDERSFLPPAPPEKETTKANSSINDTKFVFLTLNLRIEEFVLLPLSRLLKVMLIRRRFISFFSSSFY